MRKRKLTALLLVAGMIAQNAYAAEQLPLWDSFVVNASADGENSPSVTDTRLPDSEKGYWNEAGDIFTYYPGQYPEELDDDLSFALWSDAQVTEQDAYDAIMSLKEDYPEGMHWDNDDPSGGYLFRCMYMRGYGCAGFAFILSDAAFGTTQPARKIGTLDWDGLRVGDILRVNNDGHSVVILSKDGDTLTIAEGNFNSSIHWGRKMTRSQLQSSFSYQITRYPESSSSEPDGIEINADNFPDATFRKFVADNIDDGDGYLSDDEIAAVISLNVHNMGITDLKGIEIFTNLEWFVCSENQLTKLDMSKNTALTELSCGDNQLTTLDVSKNTALEGLSCSNNQLGTLDVSQNTALESLYCNNNLLTTLDVNKNTALKYLFCTDNQLTTLDVSKNTALTWLYCYDNKLTMLDVSKNTALTDLYCTYNQLTTLDMSKNTALTRLDCNDNQLTTLDVSQNTALKILNCYNNQLTTLDVSRDTALKDLTCYKNRLTKLDVSQCTALTWLYCYDNKLTMLDISRSTALARLDCRKNQLTVLDISKNTAMEELDCNKNQLTTLDISKNKVMKTLLCRDNQLTALDVSNNSKLGYLETDSDITIYGVKDTYAETYAKQKNIKFIDINASSDEPAVSGTITVSGNTEAIAGTKMSIKNSDGTDCGANIEIASDGKFTVTGTLPDGDYTITANKSKCCPRDYTVTVKNGQMSGELDVELQLYGDIDNNGIVTLDDVIDVINYFNKKTSAISSADKGTQDYLIAVSDVDGDGVIKLDDAIEMINYFNKKASAFDKIA